MARKKTAALWIAILFLVALLFISVSANLGLIVVNAVRGGMDGPSASSRPRLQEEFVSGSGHTKVLRLAVNGPIMRNVSGGGIFGVQVDMVEDLKSKIEAATADDDVAAIILEVNSPGGAVTPTDEIYRALLDFKESREDRRIVTFVRDMSASGSYWLAVAGDWIIAEPTSIVGSIGVIMQSLNWATLSERVGLSAITIKSGRNKDLLNPFVETPEEQKQLLQAMIDSLHERFKRVVSDQRGISPADLEPIADGRILDADSALEHGLIDQIGYWKDSLVYTRELLGKKNIRVIRYKQRANIFQVFASASLNEIARLVHADTPRAMSIWQ